MTEKINAALVGFNNPHSKGWWETMRHCERIGRLVACEPNEESPEFPEEAEKSYASLEELLDGEDLAFALVCGRNDQSPAMGEKLLRAGIPIIIEKPVARTAADIARLNQISAAKNVPWATGFTNRYAPIAGEFKDLVEGGALGRIVSIEGRMITSSVQQRNPQHWLFDRKKAGGGILSWLAIHTIDLIRHISGLEYRTIMGQVATLSDTDIDVEDMAAVCFTMGNGAVGNLHAGYVLGQRYGDIYLAMRGTLGDAVWLMWDYDERGYSLKIQSQAPGWETVAYKEITAEPKESPGYGGSVGQQYLTHFIDSAREGKAFVTNGIDAQRAMEVVEAAYSSSETGNAVHLE